MPTNEIKYSVKSNDLITVIGPQTMEMESNGWPQPRICVVAYTQGIPRV